MCLHTYLDHAVALDDLEGQVGEHVLQLDLHVLRLHIFGIKMTKNEMSIMHAYQSILGCPFPLYICTYIYTNTLIQPSDPPSPSTFTKRTHLPRAEVGVGVAVVPGEGALLLLDVRPRRPLREVLCCVGL